MKTTRKIWIGLGACVIASAGAGVATAAVQPVPAQGKSGPGGESGEAGAKAAPVAAPSAAPGGESGESGAMPAGGETVEGVFRGDLDVAIAKIMAGEGGEGGIGLTPMWPSVTAPALSNAQLTKVITGNTLRNDERTATYYAPDGTLSGWFTEWNKLPDAQAKQCPAVDVSGDDYLKAGSGCWKKTTNIVSGTWKIQNNQICAKQTVNGKPEDRCWHVALLLDRFALFDATGTLEGIGRILVRGKSLSQIAK